MPPSLILHYYWHNSGGGNPKVPPYLSYIIIGIIQEGEILRCPLTYLTIIIISIHVVQEEGVLWSLLPQCIYM